MRTRSQISIIVAIILLATVANGVGFNGVGFRGNVSNAYGENPLHFLGNPSYFGLNYGSEMFTYVTKKGNGGIENWGILSSGNNSGIGYISNNDRNMAILATGSDLDFAPEDSPFSDFYLGYSYKWFWQNDRNYNGWNLGTMWRPWQFVSLGWSYFSSNKFPHNHSFGFSFRPLFNDRVTLSYEGSLEEGKDLDKIHNAALLEVQPINGLKVYGKYSGFGTSDHPTNFYAGLKVNFLEQMGVGAVYEGDDSALTSQTYFLHTSSRGLESVLPSPPRKKMLKLSFDGNFRERASTFSPFGGGDASPVLYHTTRTLHKAAKDPQITGVVMDLKNFGLSLSQAEEVLSVLQKFKKKGKKIVAYVDSPDDVKLLLASIADEVYMPEASFVNLNGFSTQLIFWKNALQKIGVKADFVKIGKYKTAMETFTHDSMSPANEKELSSILDNQYGQLVKGMSKNLEKSNEKIEKLIDDGPYTAEEAKQVGLVDSLIFHDEFEDLVGTRYKTTSSYSPVDERRYDWGSPDKIALIFANGSITEGEGSSSIFGGNSIGSKDLTRAFEKAKNDESIKAIVFRINSPGGSAKASDEIWHAIQEAKRKKPVIVSMGRVAASGGYYIAAPGDKIYANSNTITGSIGVIAGKFAVSGLLDKVGARKEELKRGKNAAIWSSTDAFSPNEKKKITSLMENSYQRFKARILEDRDLSADSLQKIAQGKVWSGEKAREVGLVDSIGTLAQAIKYAQKTANMEEEESIQLSIYPYREQELFSKLRRFMGTSLLSQRSYETVKKINSIANFPYEDGEPLYLFPYQFRIE